MTYRKQLASNFIKEPIMSARLLCCLGIFLFCDQSQGTELEKTRTLGCNSLLVSQAVGNEGLAESSTVAFALPGLMTRIGPSVSNESELVRWVDGDIEVRHYNGATHSVRSAELDSDSRCLIDGVETYVRIQETGAWIFAEFSDPNRRRGNEGVMVLGASVEKRRHVLGRALATVRFINFFDKLAIVKIRPDLSRFSYRNEIGVKHSARVGDVITRDQGYVTQISRHSVTVLELIENSSGQWVEIERVLRP